MGVVPPEVLETSQAPYVDAAKIMFGGGWNQVIAFIAFLSCIGTLNAWILTSGQIASEASKEGIFPSFFSKTNRSGTPYISLLIALICTQILLFLTLTPNILEQLNKVIDLSVSIFLFIYLACSLAFLKMLIKKQIIPQNPKRYYIITLLACVFCLWILAFTSLKTLFFCSFFVLSGIPVYLWQKKKTLQKQIA